MLAARLAYCVGGVGLAAVAVLADIFNTSKVSTCIECSNIFSDHVFLSPVVVLSLLGVSVLVVAER